MAQKKKQLIAEGKLDKHGRPNEQTPKEYLRSLTDAGAAVPMQTDSAPAVEENGKGEQAEAGDAAGEKSAKKKDKKV